MERKAFVLLSGGMDSTTCLFKAIYDFAPPKLESDVAIAELIGTMLDGNGEGYEPISWVEAISVDYGQRHKKEFEYAKETCRRLGIKHSVLSIGDILSGSGVMLTDASVTVPSVSYNEITGVSPTYVPFRNGTLLSVITAFAQKYVNAQIEAKFQRSIGYNPEGNNHPEIALAYKNKIGMKEATDDAKDLCGIYFGAHSEDAHNWAYPDCTPEFIGSMANAIYTGTYYAVRLHTPLEWLTKAEIVTLGERLEVPWDSTWSCYKGEEKHCGTCPTCRARKDAFVIAKAHDPTEYANG